MSLRDTRRFVVVFYLLLLTVTSTHAGSELLTSLTLPARLSEHFFLLEVSIGGEGPFRLLLDTGAEITCITPEVASRLEPRGQLEAARRARARGASGETVRVNGVYLRDVRIGDFCVVRVHALVTDLKGANRVFPVPLDGIAGMNLFREVRLNLDYPAGYVRVEPFHAPLPSGAHRMDIARDQRIPRVMIPVAGQDYAVGLDSGALGEFCLPAIRRLPLVGRPVLAHLAISLGAQTPEKVARLATNIVLGGLRFERPIVGVDGGEGRIGAGVLRHFRVDLNQRDGWVCLTPSIDGPVTNKSVRSLGLWLAPPARGFEVMGVIPGTDAARAHIRPGDIVTRLNSESASRWTRARRHDLVEETDLVEVELVRGNQTCQHRLQVAVLVE